MVQKGYKFTSYFRQMTVMHELLPTIIVFLLFQIDRREKRHGSSMAELNLYLGNSGLNVSSNEGEPQLQERIRLLETQLEQERQKSASRPIEAQQTSQAVQGADWGSMKSFFQEQLREFKESITQQIVEDVRKEVLQSFQDSERIHQKIVEDVRKEVQQSIQSKFSSVQEWVNSIPDAIDSETCQKEPQC